MLRKALVISLFTVIVFFPGMRNFQNKGRGAISGIEFVTPLSEGNGVISISNPQRAHIAIRRLLPGFWDKSLEKNITHEK